MKIKRPIPLYPILFSIYPILALMANNLGEFELRDGWRPIIISMIGFTILWVVLRLLLRDWNRSALITSMCVGFFFIYGHLYFLLKKLRIGDFVIGRHRNLLPLLFFLFLFGVYWAIKRTKETTNLELSLNWISLILLIFPFYQVATYAIKDYQVASILEGASVELSTDETHENQFYDIYYIILDAYTRQDTLLAMYDYDNSEFIRSLTDLGFYVAECSQSNYPKTYVSLVSSLNMKYQEDIEGLKSAEQPTTLLVNNGVRAFLESRGYITVAFDSVYPWSSIKNAEYFLSYKESEKWLGEWSAIDVVSDFETLLLETTVAKAIWDVDLFKNQYSPNRVTYWKRRSLVLYTFEQLKEVYRIPEPKFVFAHIPSPHLPFLFGPNGEELVPERNPEDDIAYAEGYTNQVTFISNQALPTVEEILRNSKNPPIIILQGDHGPSEKYGTSPEYRSTILNAYYLPEGGEKLLYPDITPVNSFRIIFNHYFNEDITLLDDIHYNLFSEDDSGKNPVVDNVGPACGE